MQFGNRNIINARDISYDDAVIKNRIKPQRLIHPSLSSYNRGCRCIECKNIKKLKRIQYKHLS